MDTCLPFSNWQNYTICNQWWSVKLCTGSVMYHLMFDQVVKQIKRGSFLCQLEGKTSIRSFGKCQNRDPSFLLLDPSISFKHLPLPPAFHRLSTTISARKDCPPNFLENTQLSRFFVFCVRDFKIWLLAYLLRFFN